MSPPDFTPGPWLVHPVLAQVDSSEPSKLGGLLPVAQLLWPTSERSEAATFANARLIAAAPDLHEALVAVWAAINVNSLPAEAGLSAAADLAHAAFAKARGDA